MAHGDQFGGFLGCADAGEAGDFQRIPFRILRQLLEHAWLNANESVRHGGAPCFGFGGYVHHARAALVIVMREFFHLRSTRISSPAAHASRPGSVTRNALARASAATSPDPWVTAGSMH